MKPLIDLDGNVIGQVLEQEDLIARAKKRNSPNVDDMQKEYFLKLETSTTDGEAFILEHISRLYARIDALQRELKQIRVRGQL